MLPYICTALVLNFSVIGLGPVGAETGAGTGMGSGTGTIVGAGAGMVTGAGIGVEDGVDDADDEMPRY